MRGRGKPILAVVAVVAAVVFAGVAVLLWLDSSSSKTQENEKSTKVVRKQSVTATKKATGATAKADLSLRLNAKLVRCLTKQSAAALRKCLSVQPGAPGQRGAPGLPGTPGKSGSAGTSGLRGPRGSQGVPGTAGNTGPQGQPCSTPDCKGADGSQGVPGRPPTSSEIGDAVASYCAAHDSCRGAAGKDGSDGQNGSNGAPGADGAQGAQGPQGEPGPAPTSLTCVPSVDPGVFTCTPN